MDELRTQELREISIRMLVATDATELNRLVEQLTRIAKAQLRTHPPD